ncbi:hypothetical protein NKG05_00145 [Oerskovia sp. M15]
MMIAILSCRGSVSTGDATPTRPTPVRRRRGPGDDRSVHGASS